MKKFFLKLFPLFDSCGCQHPDYTVGVWQSTNRLGRACRKCGAAYKGGPKEGHPQKGGDPIRFKSRVSTTRRGIKKKIPRPISGCNPD